MPWILFALVLAVWVPAFIYDPLSQELTSTSSKVWAISYLAFPVVGLFLAIRLPHNAVGWLFIVGPGTIGAAVSAQEYGEATNKDFFIQLGDALYLAGLLLLFASILLFPDGRYPNRWFRRAHVALVLPFLLSPALPESFASVLVILNFVLPMVGLVTRIVTGDSVMRRQIAGPILVTLIGGLALATFAMLIPEISDPGGWITVIVFMVMTVGIPASIAISITKYRLYEIDRIISRTVSYTVVVGFLGLVFIGGVTGLTTLLPSESSDLAVAGSTLAVAALFNPVRKRVHGWVDRRFNRSRYDAERVMTGFSETLRDEVDPDAVIDGWVGAVSETMQPSAVGVWVRN